MDLSPERVGQFDVVFFLGVLYHLRHPLLALERIASVTRQRLLLETVVDMVGVARPAMAFYRGRELNNDPTNWWAPNVPALHAMLRDVGFTAVRTVTPEPGPLYRAARAVSHRLRGKNSLAGAYRQDRAVVEGSLGEVLNDCRLCHGLPTASRNTAPAVRASPSLDRRSAPLEVPSAHRCGSPVCTGDQGIA